MRRRICLFCETWESGGIESFISNILKHMSFHDLEIDIVVEALHDSVFTKDLESIGINFFELSGSTHKFAENVRAFRRLLSERKYDVVHLNIYQGMSLYYAEVARKAGVPVRIAHSHNSALRKSALRPLKMLTHNVYSSLYTRSATDLWACSEIAAEFMFSGKDLTERGYEFIPNGIDIERFRFNDEIRERVRKDNGLEDKFVVGNVGRLCYQKNQAFLLDVMVELIKKHSEAVLLLVGEGEDRRMLEEKAAALGITEQVVFYGTTDSVEELFWAMDAFAFPSRFEGFGIVAMEAQAAGLPVVCSENVPNEACVLDRVVNIPLSEGSAAWAGVIGDFLRQCGRDCCEREQGLLDDFSIDSVAANVEKVYRNENCC